MWLRFSVLLLLAGCGFEPMAARVDEGVMLPHVTVKVNASQDTKVPAQDFSNHLEDLLMQSERRNEEYILTVSLSNSISQGLVAPDGKAQRYTMNLTSTYTLERVVDNKVIDSGMVARSGSYNNRPNVYFSTFVADQDTAKRLGIELAEEYHLLLASRLGNLEKISATQQVEPMEVIYPNAPSPTAAQDEIDRKKKEEDEKEKNRRGIFRSLF